MKFIAKSVASILLVAGILWHWGVAVFILLPCVYFMLAGAIAAHCFIVTRRRVRRLIFPVTVIGMVSIREGEDGQILHEPLEPGAAYYLIVGAYGIVLYDGDHVRWRLEQPFGMLPLPPGSLFASSLIHELCEFDPVLPYECQASETFFVPVDKKDIDDLIREDLRIKNL